MSSEATISPLHLLIPCHESVSGTEDRTRHDDRCSSCSRHSGASRSRSCEPGTVDTDQLHMSMVSLVARW